MNLLIKYFISKIASKRINKSHCDNRENEYFSDDKNNIKVKKIFNMNSNFLFYFIYYLINYNSYFIFIICNLFNLII